MAVLSSQLTVPGNLLREKCQLQLLKSAQNLQHTLIASDFVSLPFDISPNYGYFIYLIAIFFKFPNMYMHICQPW